MWHMWPIREAEPWHLQPRARVGSRQVPRPYHGDAALRAERQEKGRHEKMTIVEVRGVERRGRLSCTITASVSGYLLAGSVTFTATAT